ncbi:ABC-2 transporter permease [Clostridium sp. HV4-5-A1G]|uniref:ABC-2 transporter permease n=1 Tax=Clostridium sp. HV4-5-A1G TaxID=2004595 RepID=UPI00123A7F8A|nr:ABC-2 transporter permease [Clostridium sp. HV4-5-A1G]KAA8677550.1 ABC-2 transporter permease [Clostridium sp. HV4-5-A1G]
MWNLVLKDILLQKRTFVILVLISILFTISFKDNTSVIYTSTAVFTGYAFLSNSFYRDERTEMMLNSLPINRINIVISRYLSLFIVLIISTVVLSLVFIFTKYTGIVQPPASVNTEDIIVALISILLFSSILIPIYFKYGYLKTRYVVMILFLGTYFVFMAFAKIFGEKIQPFIIYLSGISEITMRFIILAICLIVLLLSFFLSYEAYKNKEL